jgi:hypothetical protein
LVGFSIAAGAALDAASCFPFWSSWYCNTSATDTKPESNPWGARPSNTPTSCSHHTLVDAIAFTAAATGLYHLNREDQAQDRFLFGGVTSGLAIGLGKGGNMQEIILSVLPWTILLSLAASHVWSAVLKGRRMCSRWNCHNSNCPKSCSGLCYVEKPRQ